MLFLSETSEESLTNLSLCWNVFDKHDRWDISLESDVIFYSEKLNFYNSDYPDRNTTDFKICKFVGYKHTKGSIRTKI